jgi:hypothetical protein
MPQNSKPTLFPKLVLCTSLSQSYHVPYDEMEDDPNPADEALRDAIHNHLVKQFRSIFLDLEMELHEAGYEAYSEFYTDTLTEDYELRLGNKGGYPADAEAIVTRFHERARQILADLPDLVSKREVSETI